MAYCFVGKRPRLPRILRKWKSVVGTKTPTTVSFVHSSVERETSFTSETFVEPEMVRPFMRHSLNPPDGSLNLSKCNSRGTSDWLEVADKPWKCGTKHLFHIDLVKSRIFVINTADEFIAFMQEYGIRCSHSDRAKKTIVAKIEQICATIESLEEDKTDELRRQYALLWKKNEQLREFEFEAENYDSIDYARLKDEGYNGIYYSESLMSAHETVKLCRPGDGELLSYLKWLKSDTLAIWKWCF